MDETKTPFSDAEIMLTDFFEHDDLTLLAENAGKLLGCPLLIIDDSFHVSAHFCPPGFNDKTFKDAVTHGEITYEAEALISESEKLVSGEADFIKLKESDYPRRFAPLISAGVRLGFLICVDCGGALQDADETLFAKIETVLSKQLFIETSRQNRPFETTQELLIHLLNGGFESETYFKLQTTGTYLSDFHPARFALIDLTQYRDSYSEAGRLKNEIDSRFESSHAFFYKDDIFMFLKTENETKLLYPLCEKFNLKITVSEPIDSLFSLPKLFRTSYKAFEIMRAGGFKSWNVCKTENLRTPLFLSMLDGCDDLIPEELKKLAEHDRKKGTQYCETLYYYLINARSLKKTCEALYTHRNTVLYRIRRITEDFMIDIDNETEHTPMLIGTALLLYKSFGAEFFLR